MDYMGTYNGALVYNDYGHHPTEIKMTLNSFSQIKKNRLITIFQPHRYTRTRALMDDFAISFFASDYTFITDIYPASEKPIEGVTSQALVEKMKDHGYLNCKYLSDNELKNELEKLHIGKGDIILFLGAGNFYLKGFEILDEKN